MIVTPEGMLAFGVVLCIWPWIGLFQTRLA